MWEPINESILSELPGDIDFIAMAISPFHARGIQAAASKYNLSKGVILIKPHLADGYLLSVDDFSDVGDNIYVHHWDEVFENRMITWILLNISSIIELFHQSPSKTEKDLYIISPLKPDINLLPVGSYLCGNFAPQFITVDEGFGTYLNEGNFQRINRSDRLREFDLDSGLRQVMIDTVGQVHKIIESRLLESFTINKFYIFSLEDTKLRINRDVANFYRRTFNSERTTKEYECLILTQPLSEGSYLSKNDELLLIRNIISELPDRARIGIKPHPRETEDKYKQIQSRHDSVGVLAKSTPVEDIYESSNPEYVVGFTSTALLTAAAIFNIQTYTAADRLKLYTSSDVLTDNIEHFLNLTEDLITTL